MIKGTCQPKNTPNCMARKRKVSFQTVWLLSFPFFFFFHNLFLFFFFAFFLVHKSLFFLFNNHSKLISFILFYLNTIQTKLSFSHFFLLLKNDIFVFGFLFQKQFSIFFFFFSKTPTLKTNFVYLDFWESNNEIWFESSNSIAWINY